MYYMDWKSPRGITYLAKAKIECPEGQILQKLVFKQEKKKEFRYTYECVVITEELTYENVTNEWSDYLSESPDQGDVNLLDQQSLDCFGKGFLASISMEINLLTEKLRYVYKCGKISNAVGRSACEARQTQKHDAENYYLPTLEHHGIKCQGEELLSWFQLQTESNSSNGLLWYNYECCGPPSSGNLHLDEHTIPATALTNKPSGLLLRSMRILSLTFVHCIGYQ